MTVAHDERGVTLVEVLAAVTLIGIAFLTIIGGMMTAAIGSDVHRKVVDVDVELRALEEAVFAAPYVTCAGKAAYAPAAIGYTPPSGVTASVTDVDHWKAGADPKTGSFAGACGGNDEGLQRVSLTIATNDGRATASRDVLKRRP